MRLIIGFYRLVESGGVGGVGECSFQFRLVFFRVGEREKKIQLLAECMQSLQSTKQWLEIGELKNFCFIYHILKVLTIFGGLPGLPMFVNPKKSSFRRKFHPNVQKLSENTLLANF